MPNNPRPGRGQESLFAGLTDETALTPDDHLFARMSQAADAQERMDAARAYAADHTPTPTGRALLNAAELKRRAAAYPDTEDSRYVEGLERAAETGQRWAPSRSLDMEPVVETYDPAPPHGYNYLRQPGPVVGEDPTPIDGLARQEPEYPTPMERSIASRHLPRLQWEAHERAMDLRDDTPEVGIINEDDPVPVFPQPPEFKSKIHIRDDHARWYESR
jgi:hypothetical protein